jgi:hypothetical protein
MIALRSARRRQWIADRLAVFLGIVAGLWADSDDLLPRVLSAVLVAAVAIVLLRLVLRVPVWRTVPEDRPVNLPPYGEPPIR